MLIISNRAVGEGDTVISDPVVATAILDCLLHRSLIITIRGDSEHLHDLPRSPDNNSSG